MNTATARRILAHAMNFLRRIFSRRPSLDSYAPPRRPARARGSAEH